MQPTLYDQRYAGDYREHLTGYEIARWEALSRFIPRFAGIEHVHKVLDYGAGSGLYTGLWERLFPGAQLHFCDISSVARDKFRIKHPLHADRYRLLDELNRDESYDVIVSIEVMEHVEGLTSYLNDISRLLRPGGIFFWTTPCGNALSIEHIFSTITGKIETTGEGFRRWAWEDPTHLRRLRSGEIKRILTAHGFTDVHFRYRSHVFSFLCTYTPMRKLPAISEKIMKLDYTLFRCLPNGASMIGAATKRNVLG